MPLFPSYKKKLSSYKPVKPIEEVERELGISNIIKLASNENPLGPSPKALNAIESNIHNFHRYLLNQSFLIVFDKNFLL